MIITYNNITSPSDVLTFTGVPNILKISENVGGSKARFGFFIGNGLRSTVTGDSQYYVTFFGETITNVMNPSNANNKRFYIADNSLSTAMSMARAFRNCASLAAEYDIQVVEESTEILFSAKSIGKKITDANYLQRNIPNEYMGVSIVDGEGSTFFDSKIDVDVYASASSTSGNYLTTLEKNWYGNECAFDMSPVLGTFSEYGLTKPYSFVINIFQSNGEWNKLGTVSASTTIGYHSNQSDKFKYAQGTYLLLNKNRGVDNVMTLYTYSNVIPFSVMCGSNTLSWNLTVSVKDSAFNEIYANTIQGSRSSASYIVDSSVTIPQTAFTSAYFVDFTIGGETTRFNVIKPLKATEYYQRVEWRNEYGGISFFDFTGSRSESDSVDIETYEKNIFDYYVNDHFEKKMIYSNGYNKSVSLTSHLMDADGRWIFNSLMCSKKVWTYVNGKKYFIIPKSIDVQEDSTYNDIYTAKLTYEYSDI